MTSEGNGHHFGICPLAKEWESHSRRINESARKIDEMHMSMTALLKNTTHLEKLDELKNISAIMTDMRDKTFDVATGKDQMSTKTVHLLVKILSTVIVGLLAALVFVLTGQHFGFLGIPH